MLFVGPIARPDVNVRLFDYTFHRPFSVQNAVTHEPNPIVIFDQTLFKTNNVMSIKLYNKETVEYYKNMFAVDYIYLTLSVYALSIVRVLPLFRKKVEKYLKKIAETQKVKQKGKRKRRGKAKNNKIETKYGQYNEPSVISSITGLDTENYHGFRIITGYVYSSTKYGVMEERIDYLHKSKHTYTEDKKLVAWSKPQKEEVSLDKSISNLICLVIYDNYFYRNDSPEFGSLLPPNSFSFMENQKKKPLVDVVLYDFTDPKQKVNYRWNYVRKYTSAHGGIIAKILGRYTQDRDTIMSVAKRIDYYDGHAIVLSSYGDNDKRVSSDLVIFTEYKDRYSTHSGTTIVIANPKYQRLAREVVKRNSYIKPFCLDMVADPNVRAVYNSNGYLIIL